MTKLQTVTSGMLLAAPAADKNSLALEKNYDKPAEEEVFFDTQPFQKGEGDSVTQSATRLQNKVLEFMSNSKGANAGSVTWKKEDGRFEIEFRHNRGVADKPSGGDGGNQIGAKKVEVKIKVPVTRAGNGGEKPETVPPEDTTVISEHEILQSNFKFLNDGMQKNGHFLEID